MQSLAFEYPPSAYDIQQRCARSCHIVCTRLSKGQILLLLCLSLLLFLVKHLFLLLAWLPSSENDILDRIQPLLWFLLPPPLHCWPRLCPSAPASLYECTCRGC